MDIKIIKTEKEYENAIRYMEEIGDDPNFEYNPELIEKFEQLEILIEAYENENYPIEKGNPIEILKLKKEMTNNDDVITIERKKNFTMEQVNAIWTIIRFLMKDSKENPKKIYHKDDVIKMIEEEINF